MTGKNDDKFGLPRRHVLKGGVVASVALGLSAWSSSRASAATAADDASIPSLAGKTIAISATGTDHFFDLKAYQAQIEEVKRLGGTPIGLDAGRNDKALVSQLQTLVAQKPDAVIQTLGTLTVIDPWLKKLRDANIPVFTIDVPTPNSINNTTSDNFSVGSLYGGYRASGFAVGSQGPVRSGAGAWPLLVGNNAVGCPAAGSARGHTGVRQSRYWALSRHHIGDCHWPLRLSKHREGRRDRSTMARLS
jgi:hypothetical protein